jgi:L-fucose isomerase-like protein
MSNQRADREGLAHAHCCPQQDDGDHVTGGGRFGFPAGLGAAALGGAAMAMTAWSELRGAEGQLDPPPPQRRPLRVQPIFTYPLPVRLKQTSWRNWGGVQTRADVDQEAARIRGELEKMRAEADFPLDFRPLAVVREAAEVNAIPDLNTVDALLVWAAGDGGRHFTSEMDAIARLGKDSIFFLRHQSGPVYYWYEGMMARFLHHETDRLALKGIDYQDVVIDRLDDCLWRLRALCGLRNTMGSRIIAIGAARGWRTPKAPELAKERFKLDIQVVPYRELGELIKAARKDSAAVALAQRRADEYLKLPGTTLETDRAFVNNAFLLEQIFRRLMKKADCRAITIGACMSTIMPLAETSACLALSTLNDDGYLAFCESDFVVVPSGILLANISGRPVFLNDPTHPHDNVITLAHCTGPRKMDGKTLEPARLLTHFESDYGAAPKVEMRKGQVTTNIVPDFAAGRWVGLLGEIVDTPFLSICRDQVDIRYKCDSLRLAERMPGFHWMTGYGDYTRELGYALKRVGIQWEFLG